MGVTGAVGWAFERKGLIGFESEKKEEEIMEMVSDSPIDDIQFQRDEERNGVTHVVV